MNSFYSIFFTLVSLSIAFPQQQKQNQLKGRQYTCLTDSLHSPRSGSTDLSSILDFELDLFRRLSEPFRGGNFFFSPYSIWNALVMAYIGSSGRTENQLKFALGLTDKESTLRLLRELQLKYRLRMMIEQGANVFEIANRIYFDDSVVLRSCMEGILHSEIFTVDFNKPARAAKLINTFVSEKTRGKIKNIVSPNAVSGVLMALVNAAYFKGAWRYPFDSNDTKVRDFRDINGKKVPVEMMSQYGEFISTSDKELQADVMEFPYVGESMAMYIFKPHMEGQIHIDNVIYSLNHDSLLRVMRFLNDTIPKTTRLTLPRFKIDTTIEEDLKAVLEKIGITDAFDATMADFSDFSSSHQIGIQDSVHKAFVEVNEEGTEAAGSTVFISTKIGGIVSFDCNRPFVFAIVDKETNNVIFIGTLMNPPKATRPKGKPKFFSTDPLQQHLEPQQQNSEPQQNYAEPTFYNSEPQIHRSEPEKDPLEQPLTIQKEQPDQIQS